MLKINTIQYLLKINLKFVNNNTIFKSFFVANGMIVLFFRFMFLQSCADWTPENEKLLQELVTCVSLFF